MPNKSKQLVERLIAKLDANKTVSTRDIRTALGDDGVKEYENRWTAETEQRIAYENKPSAVMHYEEMLKKADFANTRAENMKVGKRSKRNALGHTSKQRLAYRAEALYEKALEQLEADVKEDNDLFIWFDRDLDFSTNGTLSIDVIGMPRAVTSRSHYKLGSGMASTCSKSDIKRELLENALTTDGYVAELTEDDMLKLKELMAKLKRKK